MKPLLLIASLNFAVWTGDVVMYALKTRLLTVFAILDLFIGIGLSYLLVERFQVYALIYVPLLNMLFKIFLAYALNNRYCFPQRFYFWQTLGASTLAGVTHYLWVRLVTGLIWQGDEITSILSLLFGLLASFPIYGFLYGLFGGLDDNTLAEFVLVAVTDGRLDFGPWEQVFYGEFDGRRRKRVSPGKNYRRVHLPMFG